MTEKRFYLMNVEDPLYEYGRWCKPVLEDGETTKQYEDALEVMDLLNDFNDENEQLKNENNILKASNGGYEDALARLEEESQRLEKELTWWKYKCGEDLND